jgi:exodeoxyribonuclease V alpha subunit
MNTPLVPAGQDAFLHLARHIFPAQAAPPNGMSTGRIHELLARLLSAAARGEGAVSAEGVGLSPGERQALAGLSDLICVEDGLLLLPRYAAQLREMRSFFEARLMQPRAEWDHSSVRTTLDLLLPREVDTHPETGAVRFDSQHQRLAVAALVDARVGVLTGGPGTGKTTTAAALLALRHRLDPQLRAEHVLVAAPTGKAACRIGEAIKKSADHLRNLEPEEKDFLKSIRCVTLHRALEWGPEPPERGGPFRRNAGRKLEARLVLVDEASMVDLSLMHALIRALPEETTLLLLGDSDQLRSVEVGGILAELVARSVKAAVLPAPNLARLAERLGLPAPGVEAVFREGIPSAARTALPPLEGLTVGLKHSRRAMNAPWVLRLAEATRPHSAAGLPEVQAVLNAEAQSTPRSLHWEQSRSARACLLHCKKSWQTWAEKAQFWTRLLAGSPAVLDTEMADGILRELGAFQLLCSTNAQVEEANTFGIRLLYGGKTAAGDQLPHGCPIIVTVNDRSVELSNGDMGIAIGSKPGEPAPVALFPGSDGAPRLLPIAQLPAHKPAFGLTIHKSQGSEWSHIVIQLPEDAGSEILTRNLLYTAVTRSSNRVDLWGPRAVLESVLAR